jgi:hypothetical protein
VCTQVADTTVRHFVGLAAEQKAPRFLRFLRSVMRVDRKWIRRNQQLIMHCLDEREAAMLLFKGPTGHAERDKLIAADDHVNNPRGLLMYHIELVDVQPIPTLFFLPPLILLTDLEPTLWSFLDARLAPP